MKALYILAILLLAVSAQAAEVTFQWNQAVTDLPNLASWSLKVRSSEAGGIETEIPVVYGGENQLTFTSTKEIVITGNPGETVRRYFNLTAISKNGNESGESNQAYAEFTLPWSDVTVPVNLTVKIVVE